MSEQIKIEPRSFNFLELDEMRGILTKRSLNREKLITEIQWYLKLPKQLHYLAPRIFEYSLYSDSPYIQMEFYGYRTLHEIFLKELRGGGYHFYLVSRFSAVFYLSWRICKFDAPIVIKNFCTWR